MRKEIDPEKLRDMVRGILPSRHRTGPRWAKAERKRGHRRAVRTDLRIEDFEETAADLLRDVSVTDIVNWRRGGDKLSHFFRWCHAITRGMSTEDALSYVRAILPKSLIGDHANAHWEGLRNPRYFGSRYVHRDPARALQSYLDSATFRLRRAYRADPGLHGRLNAAIKAARPFDEQRRLLQGLHDVKAFVHDLRPTRGHCEPHSTERAIMLRMIDEIEKGGLTAALRVFPYSFGFGGIGRPYCR